ncbi:hypothetical protein [Roseibium album]|uniref:hypothetical protein n=1 Tax=Roseibium album TaxID=311410 RepID=UPI0018CB5038|nr:hypothetical protein [Roseibium album]MBG6202020.1 hypothetical protein [Labrenzia sp. EL_13]
MTHLLGPLVAPIKAVPNTGCENKAASVGLSRRYGSMEGALAKCKFCQSDVEDGALKCPNCLEWLVPLNAGSDSKSDYPTLKFVADFSKVLAWPAILVFLVLLFRNDVSQLLIRVNSLEIAGTKSEFVEYAAVVNYIEGKAGELAEETDPAKRAALQSEIQKTVENLSGLHPLELAFLINIGRGVARDDAWGDHQNELYELQKRGFIQTEPKADSPAAITTNTYARLTESGQDFLRGIGYNIGR